MELFRSDESVFSNRPHSFHSLNDAHNFFVSMIEAIEQRIHERRQDMMLSRLDKARKIIAERYADPQFSLTQMCEELFLSSSQFSVLFKEGTGRTFIEYLTAFRINEAKKLLKTTDLKSYEVAEKVGYTDPRYFSLIFRKQTNMTPIEFRRSSAR
jgi:two-component system response regulator YesN